MLVKLYSKNKQNFTLDCNYYSGMNDEAKNLARNLKKIMDYHKHTQRDVERITGVKQKTVSNILNPGDNRSPRLDIVEDLAKGYKMKTWHLLIDSENTDLLFNLSIEKLVDNFAHSDTKGRNAVLSVSETTAHYTIEHKKTNLG